MNHTLRLVFVLLAFGVFATPGTLHAQCTRVGWVANTSPGCGALIIDLENGTILRAVSGGETLYGGKTIRFAAEPASLPYGCPADGFQTVALTCVSDTLPCVADFNVVTDGLNAFTKTFHADVYDASSQICTWTFGDGSSATGASVDHTFSNDGYFQVCLTVSDPYGCSVQKCKNVWVSEQNPNWCGYDVSVTAVGNTLVGSIFPIDSDPWNMEQVRWYNSKTNQILSTTPELNYTLPGNGSYFICAEYTVKNPEDNTLCTTTRCQQINVAEPGCINPYIANNTGICPNFYAPVCGCDGNTYLNECEAMSSGITRWWAGACGNSSSCGSDLDLKVVAGTPFAGYTVRFFNHTSGDYNLTQLDFGDGSPIWEASQWDSVEHTYAVGGIYRTTLTAWKPNNCVSTVTRLLITDAGNMSSSQMPDGTDYVMPGDANGDKKANVLDLLNLGGTFAHAGPPRPFASTAWFPQFAPNWTVATAGVNAKHADCDGNGFVNEFDAAPIAQHYQPVDTTSVFPLPGAPKIWVDFPEDTIVVTPTNAPTLQITGNLMVGSPSAPVFGLYGLACALKYPEYVKHDPQTDYDDNGLFGNSNYMLWMPKDVHNRKQLDVGFVRKYGTGTSGMGRVAEIVFQTDFIIIIDVADRTSSSVIPFTIDVRGLKAIDAEGNEIALSEPENKDTLWLKIEQLTDVDAPAYEPQVLLFPNPATDAVTVHCVENGGLEQINVVNALGQTVQTLQYNGERTVQLNTSEWSKGMFTLRLQTRQGITEKRLLVH